MAKTAKKFQMEKDEAPPQATILPGHGISPGDNGRITGKCKTCGKKLVQGTREWSEHKCPGSPARVAREEVPLDLLEEEQEPSTSPTDLKNLALVASRLLKAKEKLNWYEEKVKATKDEINVLESTTLVEAMDSAGLKRFETSEGAGIVIKPICAGSIPEKRRPEALDWLRANRYDSIIKMVVNVILPKGKRIPPEVVKSLQAKVPGIVIEEKETVHAQTLGAWAREMLEAGREFPQELLGIYVGRRATVEAKPAKTSTKET